MDLAQVKDRLKDMEDTLADAPFVVLHTFEREGRQLHLALTDRLRRAARKEGIWRSREMFITLKNASYGFDEKQARNGSGRDGIFLIDRTFRPANEMMRKLFDRFLDKPGSGIDEISAAVGVATLDLLPIRLVSHHMRLLGILARKPDADWLILVDCDRS